MDKEKEIKISKMLSYILRHRPETVNVVLDENGFINTDILLLNIKKYKNINISKEELLYVVENNEKKRFKIEDEKIRASQGHSIDIDLDLKEKIPPTILYHGTSKRFINSIKKDGLKKMSRNHVHLSDNFDTALSVGKRHGEPEVLLINAEKMHNDGYKFYLSDNNVWLVFDVDIKYIEFGKERVPS